MGMSLAIIAWAIFQSGILAVGSAAKTGASPAAPTNLLFYIIAFVVGYREEVFRALIKRVADVILTPGGSPTGPTVTGMHPTSGALGQIITITGSGLSGTTQVKFGPTPATNLNVTSDYNISATAPAGNGTVAVTVTTASGRATAGSFTYT